MPGHPAGSKEPGPCWVSRPPGPSCLAAAAVPCSSCTVCSTVGKGKRSTLLLPSDLGPQAAPALQLRCGPAADDNPQLGAPGPRLRQRFLPAGGAGVPPETIPVSRMLVGLLTLLGPSESLLPPNLTITWEGGRGLGSRECALWHLLQWQVTTQDSVYLHVKWVHQHHLLFEPTGPLRSKQTLYKQVQWKQATALMRITTKLLP